MGTSLWQKNSEEVSPGQWGISRQGSLVQEPHGEQEGPMADHTHVLSLTQSSGGGECGLPVVPKVQPLQPVHRLCSQQQVLLGEELGTVDPF